MYSSPSPNKLSTDYAPIDAELASDELIVVAVAAADEYDAGDEVVVAAQSLNDGSGDGALKQL